MLFAAGPIKTRAPQKVSATGDRLAIIDLGTNSVRFDVYHRTDFQVIRIHREKRMIRLGERVFETGRLTRTAMKRALAVFKDFRGTMDHLGVTQVNAFGTSALRTAKNSKVLVDAIKKQTGIHVKIISGSKEGLLIAKGVFSHLNPPPQRLALVDIGGGSVEITICQGKKILQHRSFDLGASRMQQNFLSKSNFWPKGKALAGELALRQNLRVQLSPLREMIAKKQCQFVIGSSGTIRSLARILKKQNKKSQPALRSDLVSLVADLRMKTPEEMLRIPGLEPKRIDLILAGAIVFEEVLFVLGAKKFYSTDYSLRDGLLAEVLSGNC